MSDSSISGPLPPYGPPIRDAVASGDTTRMRFEAENAHRWLAANPDDARVAEVQQALADLERALSA